MANKDTTALRKRAQIAKANRIMFIWVAMASVIVSASVVIVIVMAQRGLHNQKAISELSKTVSTIRKNNASVSDLEDSIRALGSDQTLLQLRVNESDNAVQVVLDALPADSNPSALGASLQTKLFPPGVEIDAIEVVPVVTLGSDETTLEPNHKIEFRFAVKGQPSELKTLLERLEKSIRTIQVTRVTAESSGGAQTLIVEGEAYYEPSRTLELRNLEIEP